MTRYTKEEIAAKIEKYGYRVVSEKSFAGPYILLHHPDVAKGGIYAKDIDGGFLSATSKEGNQLLTSITQSNGTDHNKHPTWTGDALHAVMEHTPIHLTKYTTEEQWSEIELQEAAKAYMEMLSKEQSGIKYSKAEKNRELRSNFLKKRSDSSVEYRMQNISAVLSEMNQPRIKGYMPAKNVGATSKERIKKALIAACASPAHDEAELSIKTRILTPIINLSIPPKGTQTPRRVETNQQSFARDPSVKAWVLANSKGICEACDCKAPFISSDGLPFLEVHHLTPLANGGPDTIANAVALCPNCHRRCHHSQDMATYSSAISYKIKRP